MEKSELIEAVNKLIQLVEQDKKEEVKVDSPQQRYMAFLDEAKDIGCDSNNGYAYVSTAKVLNYAKELASKHGFYIEILVLHEGDSSILKTYLLDRDTSCRLTNIPLKLNTEHLDVRKMGAEITILRRYALMLLLGIVSKVDDDEGVLDGKKPVFVSEKAIQVTVNPTEPEIKKEKKRKAPPAAKEDTKITITSVEDTVSEVNLQEVSLEIILAEPKVETPVVPEVKVEAPVVSEVKVEAPKAGNLTLEEFTRVFNLIQEKNLLHKLTDTQIKFLKSVVSGSQPFKESEVSNPYLFLKQKLLGE